MNPFLTFLIVLPLLVAALLMLGALGGLAQHGLRWDILAALIVAGSIGAYLVWLLRRTLTAKGSILEFAVTPELNETTQQFRQRLTPVVLLGTYVLLAILAIVLFGLESLRHWLGGFCFILGSLLLTFGLLAGRSFQQPPSGAQARTIQATLLDRSLTTTIRARNYILISHAALALYVTWAYQASNGAGHLSLFDLTGFLFLLGSSAVWFILRGRALKMQR
jgi:hypothetical protein